MTFCYIDFETYSPVDLRKCGATIYSEHPETGIHCIAYWISDKEREQILCWKPEPRLIVNFDLNNDRETTSLRAAAKNPDVIFVAHNVAFEQAIWKNIMVERYDFPAIPVSRWKDTMAKCYASGVGGRLALAAKTLKLESVKDEGESGKKNMLRLAKPRKLSKKNNQKFWTFTDKPDEFQLLYEYCLQDVRVLKELDETIPDLSKRERQIWEIDQRINQQGLYVDTEACEKAVKFIEIEKAALLKKFQATGCTLKPTQRDKMKAWFKDQGFEVPNTQKATLASLAGNEDTPEHVVAAIELMASANKASLAKYPAFLNRSRGDGLLREAFAYHGAHTGRWAGRGVQLQNLPRPVCDSDQIINWLKSCDHETFEYFCNAIYDIDVSKALSTALRGMIIAPPGHRLFVADFAQMENRCMAWQAGDESKLDKFRQGTDPYKLAASSIYNVRPENVNDDQRFVGKVAELSLQYQGGINAFAKMAKGYGVNLRPIYDVLIPTADDDEIGSAEFCYFMYLDAHRKTGTLEKPVSREIGYAANIIKDRWRQAHPLVTSYWTELERAACQAALSESGKAFEAGSELGQVVFFKHRKWLLCRLPSGRCLHYLYPKVSEGKRGKLVLRYLGPKGWTTTYGGKLAENITQAIQRDLLSDAMIRLESIYPVSAHVHDELISPVKFGVGDVKEFESIMREHRKWATGIPINVKGFECERYRK